ncbi:hypothetical protein GCM10022280_23920 [Sphingomonas swuensis]|uniref:Uncharacterized protein n=1 Tax=Sphingomonas swuensis TaxID=977800 RepID=A0ABP7T882_9SPHN
MAKQAALAAALLALVPVGASAQSVNPPAQIVEAAADCWAAVGETSVDQQALVAKGWKASEFKAKGKPVETPLRFYSKAKSGVMLMVLPGGKSPACTVMSRVGGEPAYRQLVSLLLQRLKSIQPGLKAGPGGDKGAAFIGGNRVALLEATGTKAAPAARIIVGYSASEKK